MESQKKQKDSSCCSQSPMKSSNNSKHPHEETLEKNPKTKQVCHSKQSNCCNSDANQQESKVLWSNTKFTGRLLAIGEHIIDFSEYLQKRVSVFKSVELHPNNPKLGFIWFTHTIPIKQLEKFLLSSGIKNLQVRAVERIDGWKDFFNHPNNFFPDYQCPIVKPECDSNNTNSLRPNNIVKQQQYNNNNNFILNNNNTTLIQNKQHIPNKKMSSQQIINIKQEVDDCTLNINEEFQASYIADESVYEKEQQQQYAPNFTSSLNSNSNTNTNLNNNLYPNKNSNLSNSMHYYTQQPQPTTIFNSSSTNHIPNSQQHIENKIYIEITQILRRNRNWENLLELVRYIELSEWISSTKKAQMLFAIAEKRIVLENILQLNQLYGQEQEQEQEQEINF